jgi:hypothetical protein
MILFRPGLWLLLFFICSAPLSAFEYTNAQLGFKANLPDGLDDYSADMKVKSLISRGSIDGSNGVIEVVFIQDLGGTIGREDLSKKTDRPQNVKLENTKWQSFDINVFRVVENVHDVPFVTFNAQVPLKPHAIQITVFGPAYDEPRLRTEMQAVVASVQGSSNWLARGGIQRRPQQQSWLTISIGLFAMIVGKLRVSKHYGLAGTGARVAGFVIFVAGFALPNLMVPVLTFVHSRGITNTAWLFVGWIALSCAFIWGVIAILVCLHGNAYAKQPEEAEAELLPATAVPPAVPDEVLVTECHMCNRPIPPELQKSARSCPRCGADLARRRR